MNDDKKFTSSILWSGKILRELERNMAIESMMYRDLPINQKHASWLDRSKAWVNSIRARVAKRIAGDNWPSEYDDDY